jgi:restriction endonuclease S subunit
VKQGDVLMSTVRPNLKAFALLTEVPDRAVASTGFAVLRAKPDRLLPGFLINMLRDDRSVDQMIGMAGKGAYPSINQTDVESLQIPVPPLELQKEIVAEIEGYQKVINGARAVLDHYRPHIPIHPDWPKRSLGSLAENLDSRRVPITKGDRKKGPFPYYGASGVVDSVADFIFDEDILLISEDGANLLARSTPIAFSVSGKCWVNNHAHVLKFAEFATQKFVEVYLNSISIEEFVTGAAQPKVNQDALNRIPIPIPDDITTQRTIMAEIEAEQALVAANRELITRFEQKIQATLARIWGEEAPAAPET